MSKADDRVSLQAAFSLHQAGQLDNAGKIYRQILERDRDNFQALHYLGVVEASIGNFAQAKSLIARSLQIQPSNIQFIENYATILCQSGDYGAALHVCEQGLRLNGANVSLLYVSATALYKLKRLQDSITQFDKLILLQPNHIEALNERGSVLAEMKKYDAALASVQKALMLQPRYAEAHLNSGNLYGSLNRHDEAVAAFNQALALKPGLVDAWLGGGNAFLHLKRYDDAFAAYDKALALKPDSAEAWLGRGHVFLQLKRYDDAFAAYGKALELKSDLAEAWLCRGNVFNKLKRHEEAAGAYAEVLKIDPQHPFTKGALLHQKMLSCDWSDVDNLIVEIDRDVALGKLSAEPFGWQGVSKSARSLQLCAELFNQNQFPASADIAPRRSSSNGKKIRIGYSSGEFREQATAHLIAGVFELHDVSRFEIYGFDGGWDDQSEIRRRINASLHKIIDISQLGDQAAFAAIQENQIDILVNLNGYFGEERTAVFARRPVPIQVNYLGFPGTMGANYMDYIIADQLVIPPSHKEFYTEKVAYLPDCYQANDRKKAISARPCRRVEYGLPEKSFVFCCFNNNYKIVPEVFDCWMRILKRVDESVLWLLQDNATAALNLRKEATARGVDAQRLVFAERISPHDHLARHRLADLFLDTLPYNAHTTASDALWAGLPVLTQIGETFPGRVAASLLHAIGLNELVTSTPQDYEELAIELAGNPEKLAAIKRKLANNRLTTPLFDTQLFTRRLEAAYSAMYERHQAGLPPDHIVVAR